MIDAEWLRTYRKVLNEGRIVTPRGRRVKEIDHHTVRVDMRYPVLRARKLNYRFMAAEALWMIQGRRDVFHANMAPFSDDGVFLAGAYGPHIHSQLHYVIKSLLHDRDTRQAALTVWTPAPTPSRDIPCTMSMVFMIRDDQLNLHVFMRSSDAWLGLPYDVFSFTMIANWVALIYNGARRFPNRSVTPGTLFLTASSCHVYEEQWYNGGDLRVEDTPPPVPTFGTVKELTDTLNLLSISKRGDMLRWWER